MGVRVRSGLSGSTRYPGLFHYKHKCEGTGLTKNSNDTEKKHKKKPCVSWTLVRSISISCLLTLSRSILYHSCSQSSVGGAPSLKRTRASLSSSS